MRLFSKRLSEFSGESRRSYQKAFSSFQFFVISHYNVTDSLHKNVIINWIIELVSRGLQPNTVSFYLDKITSIYSKVAHHLEGGKTDVFKEVKHLLKKQSSEIYYADIINSHARELAPEEKKLLIRKCRSENFIDSLQNDENWKLKWTCLALKAGIRADIILSLIGKEPERLQYLGLCQPGEIHVTEQDCARKCVTDFIYGEPLEWFAMRLRPRVKYEQILNRFALLGNQVKMPEMFYPCREIATLVGKKLLWKDKPIIHDIVFFKHRRSEIYPLFSNLYDLAWCYRIPGGKGGAAQYASIPDKAMNEFKKSLGFLSPDFELAPAGEMKLNPGDKVVIVDGKYINQEGKILKKPSYDEDGNKIYRISLLNGHGHWDIGIDARLLKKA